MRLEEVVEQRENVAALRQQFASAPEEPGESVRSAVSLVHIAEMSLKVGGRAMPHNADVAAGHFRRVLGE